MTQPILDLLQSLAILVLAIGLTIVAQRKRLK